MTRPCHKVARLAASFLVARKLMAPGKERMRCGVRDDEVMGSGDTEEPQPRAGGVAQAGQAWDEYEGDRRG